MASNCLYVLFSDRVTAGLKLDFKESCQSVVPTIALSFSRFAMMNSKLIELNINSIKEAGSMKLEQTYTKFLSTSS